MIGLIVNPIAGMGGPVALHGTDADLVSVAQSRGAIRRAPERVHRTLARLTGLVEPGAIDIVTGGGPMGADIVASLGWSPQLIDAVEAGRRRDSTQPESTEPNFTSAADTRRLAAALLDRRVDLVVFAGGDGTAVDVGSEVGDQIPIVGIPCGVKMHSSVFATSPESAADIVAAVARTSGEYPTAVGEVLDVLNTRLEATNAPTGLLQVRCPSLPTRLQHAKAATRSGDDMAALGAEVARSIGAGVTCLVGPGTTTQAVLRAMGAEGTLNGVDVVRDGRVVVRDATEHELAETLANLPTESEPARLILGVVGGQGFLLGRGNQQISADIVEMIGADNVTIIASEDKLRSLHPAVLRVDTGDAAARPVLTGYRRVITGRGRSMMMRVAA